VGSDGRGAKEGLFEDWSGGELVACLVRVLNDVNASGGLDRRKGKHVEQIDARRMAVVGADGAMARFR